MSDEIELGRNFRSSYYKSLGFRGGEKSLSHLEGLIKADVLDVEKLKTFCLMYTLPVYYRSLIWKLLLGVVPKYTDKDTCSFIREQKKQQYQDLKQALQIMGRLEHPLSSSAAVVPHQSSISPSTSHTPAINHHSEHLRLSSAQTTQAKESPDTTAASSTIVESSLPVSSMDMMTIYLLENDRLLTAGVNQLKQQPQFNLSVIAKAFQTLFEDEEESDVYWLFSGFAKKAEKSVASCEEMQTQCLICLEEVDCVLFEHLKDLDALEDRIPFKRWFGQSFAGELPESCLEIVWDRVVGGSCTVLLYVAVAILLSLKRRILGLSSSEELLKVLDTIPKDNFTFIVNNAIDLWESRGSPLQLPVLHIPADYIYQEMDP